MATAIVNTQSGGAFRLEGAFMIGMDHIGHSQVGNEFTIYPIQDGDRIRFVS